MNHPAPHISCTATVHGSVYVLTYDAHNWPGDLIETEGVELLDPYVEDGVLGVFQNSELAERIGEAWADEQLNDYLGIKSYLMTEEDRADLLHEGGWREGPDQRHDGNWRYYVEGEDHNILWLEVNKWRVVTHVDGFEGSDDENEEENGDDGEEEEENGDDGGKEEDEENIVNDGEQKKDEEKNSDGVEEPFLSTH